MNWRKGRKKYKEKSPNMNNHTTIQSSKYLPLNNFRSFMEYKADLNKKNLLESSSIISKNSSESKNNSYNLKQYNIFSPNNINNSFTKKNMIKYIKNDKNEKSKTKYSSKIDNDTLKFNIEGISPITSQRNNIILISEPMNYEFDYNDNYSNHVRKDKSINNYSSNHDLMFHHENSNFRNWNNNFIKDNLNENNINLKQPNSFKINNSKRNNTISNSFQRETLKKLNFIPKEKKKNISLKNENKNDKTLILNNSGKFKKVTLAMVSSKGRNCEDRKIMRRNRYDIGGVVDFSTEKTKKKSPYKIIKFKRFRINYDIDPKKKKLASKVIQNWWRNLNTKKNEINKILIIQKWIRGYILRKRIIKLIEYTLYFQGFCDIIKGIMNYKIKEFVFKKLFKKKNINEILINIIENKKYVLLRTFNLWKEKCKKGKINKILKRIYSIYEKNDFVKDKIKRKILNLWFRKSIKKYLSENMKMEIQIIQNVPKKNVFKNEKSIKMLFFKKKINQFSLKFLINRKIKNSKKLYFDLWKRELKKLKNNKEENINLEEKNKNFEKIREYKTEFFEINLNVKNNENKNKETLVKTKTENKKYNLKVENLYNKLVNIFDKKNKKKLINRLIWISRIKSLKILTRNIPIYYEDYNLSKYLSLWREKTSFDTMNKTKKIQKFYKNYLGIKKIKEKDNINDLLKNILHRKQKREELDLLSSLKRWRKNNKLIILEKPSEKITRVIKNYLLKKKKNNDFKVSQIISEEFKPIYKSIQKEYFEKEKKNDKIEITKPQFVDSETQIDLNIIYNETGVQYDIDKIIENFEKQFKDIKNYNCQFNNNSKQLINDINIISSFNDKKKILNESFEILQREINDNKSKIEQITKNKIEHDNLEINSDFIQFPSKTLKKFKNNKIDNFLKITILKELNQKEKNEFLYDSKRLNNENLKSNDL